MITVLESFKIREDATVLVCEQFLDENIKVHLKSNVGTHKDFVVEKARSCFSEALTRNIVLYATNDYSVITAVKFQSAETASPQR